MPGAILVLPPRQCLLGAIWAWVTTKISLDKRQDKNYSPEYMEQAPSTGHEASPQSGLGVGCKLYSSSKKDWAYVRRRGTRALLFYSLLWGFPRSCLPHVAR